MSKTHVVVVGGGFSGLRAAKHLAKQKDIHVTLIDKKNYHGFTPLLYQVATSQLSAEAAAVPFRLYFKDYDTIDIKMAHVHSIDPATLTVKTEEGSSYTGDYLVLAAGSVVNFFDTKGAKVNSYPLYTLNDAQKLRSKIISAFEDADRDPSLIDKGILNFVIVGGGPTGCELAGSIADMLNFGLPKEFLDLAIARAGVYLINAHDTLLGAFSELSQKYAIQVLEGRKVCLKLGLEAKEVAADHVVLSNGEKIAAQTIVWAGGSQAAPIGAASGLNQGHAGRITALPDLTVEGHPNIYVVGDIAAIHGPDEGMLPQLASVAVQSGAWAAKNIVRDIAKKPRLPFKYDDKGIMAMLGRDAAIAELGTERKELHGCIAYAAWLGVHLSLLDTMRQKLATLVDLLWDYFGQSPAIQILDRTTD